MPKRGQAITLMDIKQRLQEEEYFLPYHYFLSKDDLPWGMSYHACIDYLVNFVLSFPIKKARILDVGCGDGFLCYRLSRYPQLSVTGLDCSKRALEFARILNPKVNFIHADASEFHSATKFDFIFMSEVLEHIPPPKTFGLLRNLSKSLRRDGYLVVSVPSVNLPLDPKHYSHFSQQSLYEVLSCCFDVERIVGFQSKNRSLLVLRQLISNSHYQLKSKLLLNLYRHFFLRNSICSPKDSYRLIAFCRWKKC